MKNKKINSGATLRGTIFGQLLALVLLLPLRGTAQEQFFKINISWPGGDGKRLALSTSVKGISTILDSTRVINGRATLKMAAPAQFGTVYLGVNNAYMKELITYAGSTTVEISNSPSAQTSNTIKIGGSLEQDLYQQYTDIFMTGLVANLNRKKALKEAGEDPLKKDSVMKVYKPIFDSLLHVQDTVTTRYADLDIAGFILSKRIAFMAQQEREKQYNSLSERVKSGPYGIASKKIMTSILEQEVGRPAMQFTATTIADKQVKLADYKGKYVLLDFWSSTCLPCLKMAPYTKQLYDTYRKKGFEIIAVSLDTKKEDWISAVAKHGISGVQVSSLKGADDPIAKYYNVWQMPAMVLIDPNGNNLGPIDPNRLDVKLAEIFNKGI